MAFLQAFDNWLDFHIFSTIAASLSLLAGAVFSVILLRQLKREASGIGFSDKRFAFMRSSDASFELARRLIVLGYVLWVFGLISGAMFSQVTWHRYWSWEPRELFSAITVTFYSFYMICLFALKWEPRKMAKLALIGIVLVLITAIPIDLLGGLHSFQTEVM